MSSYEKQKTRLPVICRYPVPKEYIPLPITDQETMEIAFAVVAPPRYDLELYINASAENPPHISAYLPNENS